MNPTQDVLERCVAALEGGGGALALASGTAAIFNSIINICSAGEEVVSAHNLYGGTYTMFDSILPRFGIKVTFVDPRIEWVRYPGLEDDPAYPVARRYLTRGFGGMVVFGIKGGRPAGEAFINHLPLFSHLANVGDAKSLALHPASTIHSQLGEEEQKASGLTPELIRLSIRIKHIDDIRADLD